MVVCNYCNKELSDKSNLNKHQNTSKYCIKIQIQLEPDKTIENRFDCEFCKKILTTKYSLNKHLTICKSKIEKTDHIIDSLKETVKNLTKEVVQLKEKPTTINVHNTDNSTKSITNNYTSLLDCKPETVTETFKKHYNTIDHFLNGDQKKLADMTVKYFLSGKEQPMYYITDRSRNKFMYTDKENNEKEDSNAIILRSLVYRGIKPIIKNIYNDEFKRLRKELAEYQRKDDEDADLCIASRHRDLKELEEAYKQMDIIKESDDYISQLCKCLPSSIIDRIYRDNLKLSEIEYDSDEEFKRQLEYEVRMIADYSVLELQKYKDLYKSTNEIKGPQTILTNPKYRKEFMSFLMDV